MTKFSYTVKFKKTVLVSLLGFGLVQPCFALEALTDESLSQSTGEGVAFLPENFKMVFQKAEDNVANPQTNWTNRELDTGLIRIVPVGPLTTLATSTGAKKADIFLYGLALSQTDTDMTSRFSNKGVNLGTEINPWVLSVDTKDIPNFAGTSSALSYLQLEAALAKQGLYQPNETIKLGLWGDIFARDPGVADNFKAEKGAPDTNAGLLEKLRLQVIANGLYLNGSQVRVFQTLNGATGVLPTSYNNTLGLGLLLRLNTDYDSQTSGNWSNKVLRISTMETSGTTKDLSTPAISGGKAASFDNTEGLYLYDPNINLVLGSIYQPLIVDTPDGRNLSLEITQIPNQENVYKNIYTDYSGGDDTYKGSTCNVRSCGSDAKTLNGVAYQGSNATHSSISIGKVGFDTGNKNLLITDKSANVSGIVMKNASGSVNLGSAAIDGLLIQHLKISTTGL